MSASIATQQEVGVVAMGPLANLIVFLVLVGTGWAFYKVSDDSSRDGGALRCCVTGGWLHAR